MTLGGLQKLTLIDYPGKIAATVFTMGCNFSCPFCHNPELVDPQKIKDQPRIDQDDFFAFLKDRRELLEGVCITGGEPTLYPGLYEFIKKIKELGFLVKLDSNGTNPNLVAQLLTEGLVDYIAMDIKAPLERYKQIVGFDVPLLDIQRSVELTRSAPDYEFRTTVVPSLHTQKDILSIGQWLQGAKKYFLQQFRAHKTLDNSFGQEKAFEWEDILELKKQLEGFFERVEIRE